MHVVEGVHCRLVEGDVWLEEHGVVSRKTLHQHKMSAGFVYCAGRLYAISNDHDLGM